MQGNKKLGKLCHAKMKRSVSHEVTESPDKGDEEIEMWKILYYTSAGEIISKCLTMKIMYDTAPNYQP